MGRQRNDAIPAMTPSPLRSADADSGKMVGRNEKKHRRANTVGKTAEFAVDVENLKLPVGG